jgi:tyrosyl-tRNA synthetase
VSELLYGGKKISSLTDIEKQLIISETKSVSQSKTQVQKGLDIIDALVSLELVSSKSEARRLLLAQAVKITNKAVPLEYTITDKDYKDGLLLIKKGKSLGVLHIK